MGIWQSLFGEGSAEKQEEEDVLISQYYFVGSNIESNPLEEATVVLSHRPANRVNSDDGDWKWEVVKCNDRIEAAPDTDAQICVYKKGAIISAEESYQSHYAWLLNPDEIDKLDDSSTVIRKFPFPDELRGATLPVGTNWNQEQLESLLLPFKV